jgi:hypothetical protein
VNEPGFRWRLFFLFWLGAVVFVNPLGDFMCDSSFTAAIAIVDRGTMQISPNSAADISLIQGKYYCGLPPGDWLVPIPFYLILRPYLGMLPDPPASVADPAQRGRSLELPFQLPKGAYYLRLLMVVLLMGPLLGLFAALLSSYGSARARDARGAVVLPFACAMGTLLFGYCCMYSKQALATLMILTPLAARPDGEFRGRATLFSLGAILGAAVAVDYSAGLLAAATIVFLIGRLSRSDRFALIAGGAVIASGLGIYHAWMYGNPFLTPYHFRVYPTYLHPVYKGKLIDVSSYQKGLLLGLGFPTADSLFGLSFSSFKGVFCYCPALIVGFYGHFRGYAERSWRPTALYAAGAFCAYLLFNASLRGEPLWATPLCWGPRYMVLGLPLAVFGVLQLRFDSWRGPVIVAVSAASAGVALLSGMFQDLLIRPSPEMLGSAIATSFRLLVSAGPRVPVLALYGASAGAQRLVVLAYVASVVAVFSADYRRAGIAAARR